MSAVASTIQQVGTTTQGESRPHFAPGNTRGNSTRRSCFRGSRSRSSVTGNVWGQDRVPPTETYDHSYQAATLDIPTTGQRAPTSHPADQDGRTGSARFSHQHYSGGVTNSHLAPPSYHDTHGMAPGQGSKEAPSKWRSTYDAIEVPSRVPVYRPSRLFYGFQPPYSIVSPHPVPSQYIYGQGINSANDPQGYLEDLEYSQLYEEYLSAYSVLCQQLTLDYGTAICDFLNRRDRLTAGFYKAKNELAVRNAARRYHASRMGYSSGPQFDESSYGPPVNPFKSPEEWLRDQEDNQREVERIKRELAEEEKARADSQKDLASTAVQSSSPGTKGSLQVTEGEA